MTRTVSSSLCAAFAITFAFLILLAGPVTAGAPATSAPAMNFTTLYSFSQLASDNTNPDGANPSTLVVGANGDLIGTAPNGGAHGDGVIFKLTAPGHFTTLHTFSAVSGSKAANADGATPLGALLPDGHGLFYGVASAGGSNGTGTVFAINDAGNLTTLYSFSEIMGTLNSNPEGAQPSAALALAGDGTFYGTTTGGGQAGEGTLFQISEAGRFKRLYSFSPAVYFEINDDGGRPAAPLAPASDGSFYGCTTRCGPNGTGTIFRMTPEGAVSVIYAFSQLDGKQSNPDGSAPTGLTLGPDGSFYGTTSLGGKHGAGTIFQISPQGKLTILYAFSGVKGKHHTNADGAYPQGPLLLANDGCLYGVASSGGTGGAGTIFRISHAGTFESLHSFDQIVGNTTNSEGSSPAGALVQGKNGFLYGVAAKGGVHGTGTIFSIAIPAS